MAHLQIFLLGPPQIKLKGTPLLINRRKALALMAYLAMAAQPLARDTLATLLWPDSSQADARKALRRDLSELNLSLEREWIEAERESVTLRAGHWVDVLDFQRLLSPEKGDMPSLLAAVDLYRGDFLAGFTLPDCPDFDEWQYYQSEQWRQSYAVALQRLTGLLSEQANYEKALVYARRWLALDPLHESAHSQIMRLFVQMGNHAAALRQYESVQKMLGDELGVSPSAETTALYHQIRNHQLQRGKEKEAPSQPSTSRRHNLPIQTTNFIGREAELAEIRGLLLETGKCRLLNLLGPGGMGKTRLALAAAGQLLDSFADGAFFVALTGVKEAEDVLPHIAGAINFIFSGKSNPKTQLFDYLAPKRLLLVVDNFEELLDEAGLLAELLQRAPEVAILVTSRERLNLQEEWVYPVQGLAFPTIHDPTASPTDRISLDLNEYSALGLFVQRARQVAPKFVPSETDVAAMVRICQLVEGMPLGLELAAPWIQTLSCSEIADEIARNLNFLTTTIRNVPLRHRNLNVLFEQTWRLLSDEERLVMQRLSLFRGGCTREAVERVAGASLSVLSSLFDKALLRRTPLGRYELHELIRQFAEAKLQQHPVLLEESQQRHQAYYITLLARYTGGIKGPRQQAILLEIKADIDNIRLAWRQAVAKRDAAALARAAECLFVFYLYSSGHFEGQIAFQQAVAALVAEDGTEGSIPKEITVFNQQENLVGFLLAAQGYFLGRTRDPTQGQHLLEQAVALIRRAERPSLHNEGFALLWLGWIVFLQARPVALVESYVAPALEILAITGDRWAEGWGLLLWANTLSDVQPLKAEEIYARGSAVCRQSGDKSNLGYTSQMRSGVNLLLGNTERAQQYIDEAMTAFAEIQNVLGLGYAFNRQGLLCTHLGDYERAISSFQKAIVHFSEARTEANVISTQIELGRALRLHGDYEQAEQVGRHAWREATVRAHNGYIATSLSALGYLAYVRGDLRQAEEQLRAALALYQKLAFEVQVAIVSRELGVVLVAAGPHRYAEAKAILRFALEVAIRQQLAPLTLNLALAVAPILLAAAKAQQAIDLLRLVEAEEATPAESRQVARRKLLEWKNYVASEGQSAPFEKELPPLWEMMAEVMEALP